MRESIVSQVTEDDEVRPVDVDARNPGSNEANADEANADEADADHVPINAEIEIARRRLLAKRRASQWLRSAGGTTAMVTLCVLVAVSLPALLGYANIRETDDTVLGLLGWQSIARLVVGSVACCWALVSIRRD